MSDNTISIKKHILKYGLAYGGVWLLKYSVYYIIYNRLAANNWQNIIIEQLLYTGGITYGIYAFKKINNGYLKFSNAIKIGIGMSVLAAIMTTIWSLVFKNIIEPDLIDNMLNNRREKMILSNPELSPKKIDQTAPITRNNFLDTIDLAIFVFFIIMGCLISSIAGAFMYKKKKL